MIGNYEHPLLPVSALNTGSNVRCYFLVLLLHHFQRLNIWTAAQFHFRLNFRKYSSYGQAVGLVGFCTGAIQDNINIKGCVGISIKNVSI
jgi:hypothetical protein